MVAVGSACGAVVKTIDDHVGLPLANGPYHVAQNIVAIPGLESFGRIFGKPKIVGAGEHLFAPVNPPGGQQFLGTQQTQQLPNFGANQVLSAIPTRERQVSHVGLALIGEIRDKQGIFIVGVCSNVQG